MHRFTQVHRRLAILFPQVRFFFAEIVGWDTGYYRLHPLHRPSPLPLWKKPYRTFNRII